MSDLKNKRIITVATTGAWPTKENTPNVPIEPHEIAGEIYNCWKQGAAVAHIHCRDDEGKAAMVFEKFEETVRLIRARKDCDIILNITTSGGVNLREEDRLRPFYELKPEMCSYDCGTMNWQHSAVFENNPAFLEKLGRMTLEAGVKPEIEVFDPGMIYNAGYYIKKGILKTPCHFQFCMGVAGGIAATTKNLVFMKDTMDAVAPGSTWSAFGVGAGAMEILYAAVAMGGNIRVGMEDNVLYKKGVLAESNMQFVARAKRILEEFTCEAATPAEAREILGLPQTTAAARQEGRQKMGKTVRMTNSSTGGPVFVYVKDGKIVRITPMDLDKTDAASWEIEARGRKFSPPRRTTISPYTAGIKSMIYSDKRILYPMKRVDFNPDGDRNIQNRGISGYERISWDEAVDIVTNEVTRLKREYGASAILAEPSSHHMWGNVGYRFSAMNRFMNLMGYSYGTHNPDSWEGWHWGGTHMWGFSWRYGCPEQYGLLEDGLKHAEMIVFWSSDPEATGGIYGAFESTVRRQWLKELGVKMVFIDPYYNHTAGLYCDKWMAPRIGTDHAISFAIAYTWLTEGTYDKEYVATHAHGFDEWADYVLGKTDGQPKTCEWAEEESGVPACEIRALAREWAKRKTYLAAGGLGGWGGACRAPHGNEFARGMIALATMQGMGKPGSNIWSTTQGTPVDTDFYFPGYSEGGICGDIGISAGGYKFAWRMFDGRTTFPVASKTAMPQGSHIMRLKVPESIMEGKAEWTGAGFSGGDIAHQMTQYKHPAPGYSPVKMLWRYGGSEIGTMTATNRYARMYNSENLEFVVNQSIWFEGEAQFADILLPACTNFERWDISEFTNCSGYIPHTFTQCNHRVITFQMKCIEPLGESKPDYEIFKLFADKMGFGEIYTEGKDDLAWIEQYYNATDMPKYMTFDEFREKGYFIVPVNPDLKKTVALRWFAEDREKDTPDWGPHPANTVGLKGLQTRTGKVEFIASSIKNFEEQGYVDEGRPAMHTYVPAFESHHSPLIEKYPIGVIAPHPKFSFHTMGDGKDSFMNDIKDHRVLIDGHYYWIIRMNSRDAKDRGIRDGDLVRAYNDRGSVILAAQVGERVPPGVAHSYESCAEYNPLGTPGKSADRAGCINILSPDQFLSKYSSGMAPNGMLVEIEKWDGGIYEAAN